MIVSTDQLDMLLPFGYVALYAGHYNTLNPSIPISKILLPSGRCWGHTYLMSSQVTSTSPGYSYFSNLAFLHNFPFFNHVTSPLLYL